MVDSMVTIVACCGEELRRDRAVLYGAQGRLAGD